MKNDNFKDIVIFLYFNQKKDIKTISKIVRISRPTIYKIIKKFLRDEGKKFTL